MNDYFNLKSHRRVLTAMLALLACLASPALAQETLTVGDGSATSNKVPVDGYNADGQKKAEFLIPASSLSDMAGTKISQMSFELSTVPNKAWTSTFKVFLKEVSQSEFTISSSYYGATGTFFGDADATTVYTGSLDATSGTLDISFDDAYDYEGGNLVVGFYITSTTNAYADAKFKGEETDVYSACYGSSSSSTGTSLKFLPKTTFTYTAEAATGPALRVKDGSAKISSGYDYQFGLALPGTAKVFTLANTGSGQLDLAVSATGGYGATLSQTAIAAGEEATLTVTMSETSGNGTVTLTSTSEGIDDFIINVSGTARDESKMWVNFADGLPQGWTNADNISISTTGAGEGTSGGGYASQSAYSYKRLVSPLVTIAEDESIWLLVSSTSSYASYSDLQVQYSADGTNWTTAKQFTNNSYGSWTSVEVTELPAGTYYLGFYARYVNFTDIYGGTESTAPIVALSQQSYDFGVISADTESAAITITNTGKSALTGLTAASDNSAFSVAIADGATTIAPNGGTATFTVTMQAANTGAQTATITFSSDNAADLTLSVSGAVAKAGTVTVDFNDNQMPEGWENTASNKWTFEDGKAVAKGQSNSPAELVSKKVKFADGDFLVISATSYDNYDDNYLEIQGSADNGETWTAFTAKKFVSKSQIPYGSYATLIVSDIPSTVNKLKFRGYYVRVDEIGGLSYDDNDPAIAVFSDAEGTTAVESGTALDLGWTTDDATATYYIKNSGTGTLTIESISCPDGITAATAGQATTVAAQGEALQLTVTMAATDNEGLHQGTITIATDGGTFLLPVSGLVRQADKLFVDFAAADAAFPAGWQTGNWTISNGTAAAKGDLQTTTLVAAAGEKFYVEAISTGSYWSSPALSYSCSADGGETWSDATSVAAQLSTSAYTTIAIGDMAQAEAESSLLVKLTGQNVSVRRLYGFTPFTEPIMTTTAADIDFGMQTDESEPQTFTVSNEGTAPLQGLTLTLGKTGDAAEYSIALTMDDQPFEATELAPGQTVTVEVRQLFDLSATGDKSDLLTIAADDQQPVTISLKGATRDASKFYADFEDGNLPQGWTANSWKVTTTQDNHVAYPGFTASALLSTPMTVAEGETLTFKAARQYYNSEPTVQVRYTTDGGVTWSDYQDFSAQVTTTGFVNLTLSGVPAGTAVIEFYGRYFYLDQVSGFTPTEAPMIALTAGSDAVATGSQKDFGNLTADATATYTLTNNGNADLVSTVTVSGSLTADVTTVTLAPGEHTDIIVTMPFEAPFGDKSGTLTVSSEGWVGDITLGFTGHAIDPTAFYADFSDNQKPAGFYSDGWTYGNGYAANTTAADATLITYLLTVSGEDDVLHYDARAMNTGWGETLTVSYSTDRANWTEVATLGTDDLTAEFQTFEISGVPAGDVYLQFQGQRVYVDNLSGWHFATPVAEHDLYITAATLPAETIVPGTAYTASVSVVSLRADETVSAELYFGETKVGELTAQELTTDQPATLQLEGNAPEAEGTYEVYAKVFNADAEVLTEKVSVQLAHVRTLAVEAFARHMADDEADVPEADANNEVAASFDITVRNTGTTAVTPTVSVLLGEAVMGTATATEPLAADATTVLTVNATAIPAGEGGELTFTANASLDDAVFGFDTPVTITVKAASPRFGLALKDGETLASGATADYGLVTEATTKTFTVSNTGTKALTLVSISVPQGFSATELTDDNRTVAIGATLDVDITLLAAQGKCQGEAVITYLTGQADATATFTLNLSGRSIEADTWMAAFDDCEAALPAGWTNNGGWTIAGEFSSYPGAAYSYGSNASWLMTPRLAANEGEQLTFDLGVSNTSLLVEYSTDKQQWTEFATLTTAGEQTFTAPATGNYYLRFTGTYAYLSNFIGFHLNQLEHDAEIAAADVPATATQYADYTATVTLKENVGKTEQLSARLVVDGQEVATATGTVEPYATATLTLTWEPQQPTDEAVKASIEVNYDGGTLQTAETMLTITAPYTLDEMADYSNGVESGQYDVVLVKRTFDAGWNTICLPFDFDAKAIHAEAKVYAPEAYSETDNELTFRETTDVLEAATPYVVYLPEAVSETLKVKQVTISSLNSTPFYTRLEPVRFQGTYSPMDAEALAGSTVLSAEGCLEQASQATTLAGFRGYLTGVGAGARAVFIDSDGTITAIADAKTAHQAADGTYNLNGQRVETLKRSGLYIVNGRKVVRR